MCKTENLSIKHSHKQCCTKALILYLVFKMCPKPYWQHYIIDCTRRTLSDMHPIDQTYHVIVWAKLFWCPIIFNANMRLDWKLWVGISLNFTKNQMWGRKDNHFCAYGRPHQKEVPFLPAVLFGMNALVFLNNISYFFAMHISYSKIIGVIFLWKSIARLSKPADLK